MSDSPAPAAPTKADAILCPSHYPKLGAGEDRHVKLKEEFAPVLGSALVHARSVGGRATNFLTGTTTMKNGMGVCRYFPNHHPKAGQDRYVWTDRGDGSGVMYGVLTPEAAADEA